MEFHELGMEFHQFPKGGKRGSKDGLWIINNYDALIFRNCMFLKFLSFHQSTTRRFWIYPGLSLGWIDEFDFQVPCRFKN